jgi:hypothetical protein
MTECNFCTLQNIKKVADKAGGFVWVTAKPTDFAPDAVDVFIHYPKDDKPTWTAWLMKLPNQCAC